MANKNFEVKHGLSVGGTERITAAGAGSLTNLTLSGNLTVQGTTVTLDASTLQVADKNIVLNYHASNDTSSASSGAGITIQDAVNGTTDATILWDASDDEFDFSHAINIPNLKVSGAQGTDGQLLTSTGSGVAWEDAPASGPTFKAFGTSSIMVGDSTTGTINAANYNTGLGIDVFANLTTGDNNVAIGFEAGKGITNQGDNVFLGYQAGKSNQYYQSVLIGSGAGRDLVSWRAIAIGHTAMQENTGYTVGDVAIGYGAMRYKNASFGESIAIGKMTMEGNSNDSSTGNRNICIGAYAMQNYTTAFYNITLGNNAGGGITEGDNNILIGNGAGSLITTGSKNIVIGEYNGNESGLDIRTSSGNIILADADANIRMRIDSSGNVGIGTTSPANALDVQTSAGKFSVEALGGGSVRLASNGSMGMNVAAGYSYEIDVGGSEVMRIDSSGNVGIGLTPTGYLTSGYVARLYGGAQTYISFNNSTHTTQVLGGFVVGNDASAARITQRENQPMIFATNDAERMRIDSSGNLMVGTTDDAAGAGNTLTGISLRGGTDNRSFFSVNQNYVMHLNRKGNDGNILEFAKDGTNVGSIGTEGGDIVIGTGDTAVQFADSLDCIRPFTSSGSGNGGRDNAIDLGASGQRFKDLYLSGGVYLGGTGSTNHLDDYEFGGWTPALQNVTTSSISHYSLYTKIGRICHIHSKITATVTSLPGANFAISGLPFTAKDSSDSQQRALIAIGGDSQNLGSYANGRAHFRTNGTQLQGVWLNSGSTAYWNYNSMDHTTFEIHVHGHYTVD